MVTVKQKAQSVLWYSEFKLSITVQRHFQCEYRDNLQSHNSIKLWVKQFKRDTQCSKAKISW